MASTKRQNRVISQTVQSQLAKPSVEPDILPTELPLTILGDNSHFAPFIDVPWNNLDDLRRNRTRLTTTQQLLLDTVHYKLDDDLRNFFHRRWPHHDWYKDFAPVVTMGKGLASLNFVNCGTHRGPKAKKWRNRCSDRWLCPFCNYQIKFDYWMKYVEAYGSRKFALMTLGPAESVYAEPGADLTADVVWKDIKKILDWMVKKKVLQGYLASEELHLDSLSSPIRVYPHTHAVVAYEDRINVGLVEESMKTAVALVSRRSYVTFRADSGRIDEIKTHKGFINAIGYLFKPLQILKAYRDALTSSETWEINQNLKCFFEYFDELSQWRSRHVFAKGCFSKSKTSDYIGNDPSPEREALLKRILHAGQEDLGDE